MKRLWSNSARLAAVIVTVQVIAAPCAVLAATNKNKPAHLPVAHMPGFKLAPFYPPEDPPEAKPTETLADAIALAYRSNPTLQARRYDLKATDETLGQALSELRPTTEVQLLGHYDYTDQGRKSEALRFLARSSVVTNNYFNSQLVINQPLLTGGRAPADIDAASNVIKAGRAGLKVAEGDLLLQTITAYVGVRRDSSIITIRRRNLAQLAATLTEVKARREAGELTRTDIAQAETQLAAAEALYNNSQEQLEAGRATYTALVGVVPGQLAQEPALPQLPQTADQAFELASNNNPELQQALFNERASRARISAARATRRPTFSLRGTLALNGQVYPYYFYNEDKGAVVEGTLTIPLTTGGRADSQIRQSLETNSGDRLRIEAARRAMVLNINNTWNQVVTAQRNRLTVEAQVKSAKVYYEGTFEEYRAGLKSTFDVLYAQGNVRDAEIALVAAKHDLYIAKASVLRYAGLLEVSNLLTNVGIYDPSRDMRDVEQRGGVVWDSAVAALDGTLTAKPHTVRLEEPENRRGRAEMRPSYGPPLPDRFSTASPIVPVPGTTGVPLDQ